MNSKIKILFLVLLVLGIIAVFFFAPTKSSIVLETAHVDNVPPHDHDSHTDTVDDTGHRIEVESPVFLAKKDTWITDIDFTVKNASPTVLHHAVLVNGNTYIPSWCTNDPDPRFYYMLGQDHMFDPNVHFPKGYALFVPRGTRLFLDTMFHNPSPPLGTGETYHDVSAQMTLTTQEPSLMHPLKPLSFYFLHLADKPCGPSDLGVMFSVPANTAHYNKISSGTVHPEQVTIPSPMTIKFWGGHIHGWEGGKNLVVKKNGANLKEFLTTSETDNPNLFDTPREATDIHLQANDVISIESMYDNPSKEPILGAMAIFGMYVSND